MSKFINDTTIEVKKVIEEQQKALQALKQQEQNEDTKKALKALETRIKSNKKLLAALSVSDVSKIISAHKIDITAMLHERTKNTREAKKRLIQHLDAIASNDAEKLATCDYKLYSACIAKRDQCATDKALSTSKLQSVFSHKTKTQANYFANFASHLKIAEVKRAKRNEIESVTLKSDSAIFKKIAALFT